MGIWLLEFTKLLTIKATLRGTVIYLCVGVGVEGRMSRLPHTRAHVEVRGKFSSHFSLACFRGRLPPVSVAELYPLG